MTSFKDFTDRLSALIQKNPHLIRTTLSNIFTMRLIGNKTHGDLAEIAIAEFINQYMVGFRSKHVGKELYRSKEHEEDITIVDEATKDEFSVSLKAYGAGALQLSTDRASRMFPKLEATGKQIEGDALAALWREPPFDAFESLNVLPLIYDEKKQQCNILVFDHERAKARVHRIALVEPGKGRKHPVYRFHDKDNGYVCEVRYGGASANALQRGLWTHTKNAEGYFGSITGGWLGYTQDPTLVEVLSHVLLATSQGHEAALEFLADDIETQKKASTLA